MRTGNEARAAVLGGEVVERPHARDHHRRVRALQMTRHHDVVAVHRLRVLARTDVDRGHARQQAAAVEQRVRRSAARSSCSGIAWNAGILGQQVVHAPGRVPLGRRPLRLDVQLALEPADRVAQRVDELGLDRVLDDRVAVDVDPGEMVENRGFGERHHDTIADMEPLDNPVWHALTGPQAEFSEGSSLALRYQTDVAVFAALPDEVGPRRLGRARRPRRAGRRRGALPARARSTLPRRLGDRDPHELAADDRDRADRRTRRLRSCALGAPDVAEMLALVERTRPGPFAHARSSSARTSAAAPSRRPPRRDDGRARAPRRATPS